MLVISNRDDDTYFSKKMLEKMEKSIQAGKKGKTRQISGKEALVNFLNEL